MLTFEKNMLDRENQKVSPLEPDEKLLDSFDDDQSIGVKSKITSGDKTGNTSSLKEINKFEQGLLDHLAKKRSQAEVEMELEERKMKLKREEFEIEKAREELEMKKKKEERDDKKDSLMLSLLDKLANKFN